MQITKGKIFGILLTCTILTWILGSVGLFLFIKHKKGYDAIKYSDVAFPWKWDELRPKWGDYFVDKGIEHQKAGQWDQAFYFTRVGISKSPANLKGRLTLADLLFQANDVVQAVQVLEAGLEYADKNQDFWAKLIQFLQYYQADQEIIRILSKARSEDRIPDSHAEQAQAALANAHYHQAEFDRALELVGKSSSISNQLIRSQIHWDQGLESLAIQTLESINSMFPNQREVVPILTRFYQDSGETEKALQLSKSIYLKNPYSIGASVNYFRVLGKEAGPEIDRFLVRVPEIYENQEALFLLANFLSETGHHERLEALISNSKPEFRDAAMVWFLRVESLVNGNAYELANDMLQNPPETVNQLIPLHRILFNSLAMTTHFATGATDKGKISMQQLFVSGHIRPATLLRLAKKIMEVGHAEAARSILQYLLKQNPGNKAALSEKIRMEIQTGNTAVAIEESKAMVEKNTMSSQLKTELITHLVSDAQLYHNGGEELVRQMLDSMTPTKKEQLLETL